MQYVCGGEVMSWVSKYMKDIETEIKNYAINMELELRHQAHRDTGALQASITRKKIDRYNWKVGVDASKLKSDPRNRSNFDYSMSYWKGHGAYRVTAKNKKALHWVDKNGNDRFAKWVDIPASSGDPFVERAIENRPKFGG